MPERESMSSEAIDAHKKEGATIALKAAAIDEEAVQRILNLDQEELHRERESLQLRLDEYRAKEASGQTSSSETTQDLSEHQIAGMIEAINLLLADPSEFSQIKNVPSGTIIYGKRPEVSE